MKNFFLLSVFLSSIIVSAQTLNDSLLIYYPFNGNANDASGNSYHGTAQATLTSDRFGNPSSAYHFNGVDEYIEFPLMSALKPELPVSYSFWIKLEDLSPTKTVFVTNDFALDNHSGVWMNMSGTGVLAINFGDATGNTTDANLRNLKGTTMLSTGIWYHVVGVVNGPNDMKLYVDCVDDSGVYGGTGGDVAYTNAPGNIGRKDVATVAPYYFQGTLDDFRYWNRALTQSDIDLLCNETVSVPEETVKAEIITFPNPVQGNTLNFKTAGVSVEKIRIVNTSGQVVFESQFNENMNIEDLVQGLYFIEFYDVSGVKLETQKLNKL